MQGRSENQRDLLNAESVVGHLVKPGSVFAFLADYRRVLFPDEMFADLLPSGRGRRSVPADVIASVVVLQTLHGLSDSETTDALTFDLRWKAAVGWPLTGKAFHDTTLTVWRKRLLASADPSRIFTAVSKVVEQAGVLKGKTRRALDSTVLDDAVATQDTVTQLIAAVRRVRRLVPEAAQVVAQVTSAHDYDDPGKPTIAWDDKDARDALIDALVRDALAVLAALPEQSAGSGRGRGRAARAGRRSGRRAHRPRSCWRRPGCGAALADRSAGRAGPGHQRRESRCPARSQDGPPPARRVQGAHRDRARDRSGDGGRVVPKAAGPGSHDAEAGIDLLTDETEPVDVLGDSAYATGEALATFAETGHTPLVKPWSSKPAVPGGFHIDDFTIDLTARTATCPAGQTVQIGDSGGAHFGSRCAG